MKKKSGIKIKDLVGDLTYKDIKKREWRIPRIWKDEKKVIFSNYLISYDGIILRKNKGKNTYVGKRLNCSIPDLNGYIRIKLYARKVKYRVFLHRLLWETWIEKIPKGKEINHNNPKGDKAKNNLEYLECVTRKENMQHARENGLAYTENQRKLISEANIGRVVSKETRLKIGKANKGRVVSKETRLKKSKNMTGEKNPMFKKHHSEETKRKWRIDRSGEKHPNVKITDNQVKEIRILGYIDHLKQKDIAKKIGTTKSNVNAILQGYTRNPDNLSKSELIQQTKESRA